MPPLSSELAASTLSVVRLVATDVDGTLTLGGKFTPAVLQAVVDLQAVGVEVLLVTGRSAGWVQSLVNYGTVVGAIAENGGVFYASGDALPQLLSDVADLTAHRQQLAQMFAYLQTHYPQLQESTDNRFRLTDWTFDVQTLSPDDLTLLSTLCHREGWGFTYSTVQCHIKPLGQDKASGLQRVLAQQFSEYTTDQVVTVGDSPNDESLFDPTQFPLSVGVANVQHYVTQLQHFPAYVTDGSESLGFCQLAALICQAKLKYS